MSSSGCRVSPETRLKRKLREKDEIVQDAYMVLAQQQVMIEDLTLAVATMQAGGGEPA
jgi:hypothetical protein